MSEREFSLGAAMAGGNANKDRAKPDNEFFPTPVEAIDALMEHEGGALRRYERIWEPCCGNGQSARALEFYRFEVIGTDLIDRGYGTGSLDFLQWEGTPPAKAIVSNFPFSLALEFVLKAKSLGIEYMAVLHKTTYWNATDRDRLWAIWQPARRYSLTFRLDFLGLGGGTMDCDWYVWDIAHTHPESFWRRMGKPPARGQFNLLGDGR